MDKDTLHYIDSPDLHSLFKKNISIQSFNQSTELIKDNHREIFSKIYYVVSLIFAVFLSIFSKYLGAITFLVILDLLILILVYQAYKYRIRRNELAEHHWEIGRNLNEWGIDVRPVK